MPINKIKAVAVVQALTVVAYMFAHYVHFGFDPGLGGLISGAITTVVGYMTPLEQQVPASAPAKD